MFNVENLQSFLIALTIFFAAWPIYRPVNGRYWMLAIPYVLAIVGLCIQYEMMWQRLVDALPGPFVQIFIPFAFHLSAYFVKRFGIKV